MKARLLKHVLGLALVCAVTSTFAQRVNYNGQPLQFGDNKPYASGGTIMMPARDTAAAIDGLLERNANGKHIEILWNSSRVGFTQGEKRFTFNGKVFRLPVSSQSRGGVLYIPIDIFTRLTNGAVTRGGGGNRQNGIYFDDRRINLTGNNAPYRKEGVVMVPFRAFGDAIGASTGRSEDGKRVTINFGGNNVQYDKGHIWYRFNGERRDLNTISEDRGGILFVPVTLYVAVTRGRVTLS